MIEQVDKEIQDDLKLKVANAIQQDQIKKEQLKQNNCDSDGDEMPFTDDSDEDEKYLASEVAYEKWKFREIMRIQLSLKLTSTSNCKV